MWVGEEMAASGHELITACVDCPVGTAEVRRHRHGVGGPVAPQVRLERVSESSGLREVSCARGRGWGDTCAFFPGTCCKWGRLLVPGGFVGCRSRFLRDHRQL